MTPRRYQCSGRLSCRAGLVKLDYDVRSDPPVPRWRVVRGVAGGPGVLGAAVAGVVVIRPSHRRVYSVAAKPTLTSGVLAQMVSWQVWQTTRVLRRRRAISCAHAGCGRPGWSRSASLRTWCTWVGADLASLRLEPGDQLRVADDGRAG
jgi:hypothetical protein